MDADQNKQTDNFIKKIVSEAGVEKPSASFTDSIMQDLHQSEISELKTGDKPLINKYLWMVFGLIIIAACAVLLLGNWETNFTVPYVEDLAKLNFINALNDLDSITMDNINIHSNVVYAVLMLSIFFYIQMLLLEKRVPQ